MKSSFIYSTGSYLPESIVYNEDLSQFPEVALDMIAVKTGVICRRQASEDQCTSDLAVEAATNCLDRTGFPVEEIEVIIVSTSSPDRIQPATATRVQKKLGAVNAFAFDMNSVCSGSVFGIELADSLIKSGNYKNVLFIASEVYSKITNRMDFSTYPFFGDGAGAIFFHRSDSDKGVVTSCLKTDGTGHSTICVPGGGTMIPFEKVDSKNAYFEMNGKEVFNFAVNKGTEVILDIIRKTKIDIDDISQFICHQANINILNNIAENLNISRSKFFVNLHNYGNTASASVLIALDEAMSNNIIKNGDMIITASYGGGLSWGANLIQV